MNPIMNEMMNLIMVWGYQFKSLKNIDDWLKRRKIYYENAGVYITYQMLKNKETI
jgi:hypothetical protein